MKAVKYFLVPTQSFSIILGIAYGGYVNDDFWHEPHTTFFLKRYPTLQIEFHDPYATTRDDIPIGQLPPEWRSDLADYCKYRFGIADSNTAALEICKEEITRSYTSDT